MVVCDITLTKVMGVWFLWQVRVVAESDPLRTMQDTKVSHLSTSAATLLCCSSVFLPMSVITLCLVL